MAPRALLWCCSMFPERISDVSEVTRCRSGAVLHSASLGFEMFDVKLRSRTSQPCKDPRERVLTSKQNCLEQKTSFLQRWRLSTRMPATPWFPHKLVRVLIARTRLGWPTVTAVSEGQLRSLARLAWVHVEEGATCDFTRAVIGPVLHNLRIGFRGRV